MANPGLNMAPEHNLKPNGLTKAGPSPKMGEIVSNFTNSAKEYSETGREYVRENPVKGVAIAAATGALVGCLYMAFRRRS